MKNYNTKYSYRSHANTLCNPSIVLYKITNSKIYISLIIILLLMLLTYPAYAQSWEGLYKNAVVYHKAGKLHNAYDYINESLEAAKKEFGVYSENFVLSYIELTLVLKDELGEKDTLYARSLNNLAELYKALEQYENAEPLIKEAIKIYHESHGEEQLDYAVSLSNLAGLYESKGNYDEAEKLYKESLKIFKTLFGITNPQYATVLNDLALLYKKMGQLDLAEKLLNKALKIRKVSLGEKHPDYIESINNLGFLFCYIGKYKKAELLFKKSINISKELFGENDQRYTILLNNLAELYRQIGQYNKAEPIYKESINILGSVLGKKHSDYARLLTNLGTLYKETGQFEKAEILYKESTKILVDVLGKKNIDYATDLNNLAELYKDMGQYEKAEPFYKEALNIRKEILGEKHPEYAVSIMNLALLYYKLGQYEKTIDLYKEAIVLMDSSIGKNNIYYATFLNNMGGIFTDIGQYEKAKILYFEALDIVKKIFGNEHPYYATSLDNLAGIYRKMGQFNKSELLCKEALKIYKKVLGELHPDYATSLNNLAALYDRMGQYVSAEKFWKESLNIRKLVLGEKHPSYAESLNNLAGFYERLGQYEKSEPLYIKANQNLINQIKTFFPYLSEKEKLQFSKTTEFRFENFNSFVTKRINQNLSLAGDMLDLRLATKGLVLASTSNLKMRILNSKDSTLMDLYENLITLRSQMSSAYMLTLDEQNKREINFSELESQANEIEKKLSINSEVFKTELEQRTITWKDIQKKLKQNEIAIEFIDFHNFGNKLSDTINYYALIIKPTYEYPKLVKLTTEKVLSEFFAFDNQYSYVNNKAKRIELYKLIWLPLIPYLGEVNKIYLSPSGLLNKLSFSALGPSESELLIDKYDLNYVNNLKDITIENESVNENHFTAALFGGAIYDVDSISICKSVQNLKRGFGNEYDSSDIEHSSKLNNYLKESSQFSYLKGTIDEVRKVGEILTINNWHADEFIGVNANEDVLKQLNYEKSPTILHIATHGFFFPEPPLDYESFNEKNTIFKLSENPLLRSGLVLSGANRVWTGQPPIKSIEDGVVTAYEVSNLDLMNTELVVLSACETGLGDIKGGEGVFGLQRAFKIAGAKSIIMSLWKIPDEQTVVLMELFYKNWLGGMTKHEAFYDAQKEMRKIFEPYYWAGFVMVE